MVANVRHERRGQRPLRGLWHVRSMERLDSIVLCDQCDPDCQQQAQRRIQQRVERGEPAAMNPLEEPDVLELADGARKQTESQRKARPRQDLGRDTYSHETCGCSHEKRAQKQHDADSNRGPGRRNEQRLARDAWNCANTTFRRQGCHAKVPKRQHYEDEADAKGESRVQWDLTFDMSGGPKGAKRPLERPLDGGVRPRRSAHMQQRLQLDRGAL